MAPPGLPTNGLELREVSTLGGQQRRDPPDDGGQRHV